ncbi:MAG: MMPL family transporter [Actinomycetota bacterium]
MFTSLGRQIVRRRRLVLVASVTALVVAAVLGTGVFSRLAGGGFDDPDAESTRADELLASYGVGSPQLVLLVDAVGGDVDAPEVADAAADLEATIASFEGVEGVASYWSLGEPDGLRSEIGDAAIVVATIFGTEDEQEERALEVIEAVEGEGPVFEVSAGGEAAVFNAIGERLESDLALAEMIAIPLTLLLLVIVFRGIVAALLPVAVGIMSIFGAFFVLWLVAGITDVSVFSINLVIALGLGLAIDYSLFVVSRFREELAAGHDSDAAVVRTVETAGRTVTFSALTVGVSLASLLVFPLYFLRSFAYAGIGVILVAMAASVVTLPALLAVLGHRVNSWSVGRRSTTVTGTLDNFWARAGRRVLARPGVVAVSTIAVLVFVGLPFLSVEFGNPDARSLPEGNEARVTTERLASEFSSNEADAFSVVVPQGADLDALDDYAATVSALGDIDRVDTATGSYVDGVLVAEPGPASGQYLLEPGAAWLSVVPDFVPMSSIGEDRIAEIRDLDAPFETVVGGATAQLIDTRSAIFAMAPIAAGWIALATFVLLFLMFGSVLVPLKAIVLNMLSLTATFGAMVWIFQDGNLSGLLDFTATGLTDVSMPILMFAIAFGLSMDYEVFLLSRIKEEYDRTGDNDAAIVSGLAKTGSIVTAAALVLSVTFFSFATSGITFMKLFGLGLGIAVLVDAFIVRATLVPALMKLAGDANWWAPTWARRIHERFGIDESGPSRDIATDARDDERELEPIG